MNTESSSSQEHLRRTESLSISPEVFEKLYLSPENAVKGDLRKTFGYPTPVALIGFLVALSPLSIEFMGWRGAGGVSATIGANYFFGGLLLIIAGVLEFFLGNTFPTIVFLGYGAHFLTFAATFQPFYTAHPSYTDPTAPSQQQTPAFAAFLAFYALFMGVLSFVFLICSLRTNVVFVLIFISATLGFCFAAASFWISAQGMAIRATLLKGRGGAFFAAAIFGWYLLAVIMFATLDLPFLAQLQVGYLSTVIKGRS